MIVMLVYIAFRFRLQYGLGAIVATIHDVIVTLGIFCLTHQEWSIPVVAAFLTLTGYSTNDTIVVFDRIRENLKKKGAGNLEQTINTSINQTLSRTLITSGLTWLVVVASSCWRRGPPGFSFVLMIGIIVGTYSSIFIASPIVIFWERAFAKKKAAAGRLVPAPAPGPEPAPGAPERRADLRRRRPSWSARTRLRAPSSGLS
jgi:preprotein translocase subunit SecF